MKYPNLELYAGLKPCEDELFDLINKNFFLIDTFWMLRIKARVADLPIDPEQGDSYIYDNKIAIFDGKNWVYSEFKDGMYFYIIDEHDFFFYDGGIIGFGDRFGKFPEHSLNNSVAIFQGETGKFITDSGITITDRTTLNAVNIYSENIYSENIYSENIHSDNAYFDHVDSFNIYSENSVSENIFNKNLESENASIDDLEVNNSLTLKSVELTMSGEDQDIPDVSAVQIILLGGFLESISTISKTQGNILTLINKTGKKVLIKDGLGIYTGQSKAINIEIDGSMIFQKKGSDWYVTGGSGGGGSQTLSTLLQLTADDTLSDWTGTATFAISKANPMHGDAHYLLTMTDEEKATHKGVKVDPAFRGKTLALTLLYRGNSLDPITGTAKVALRDQDDNIFYEEDLSTITSSIQKFGVTFFMPRDTTLVKFEIECTSTVADEYLQFDDIELSDALLKSVDIGDLYQSETLSTTGSVTQSSDLSSFTKSGSKANSSLYSLSSSGIVALRDIIVSTSYQGAKVGTVSEVAIYVDGVRKSSDTSRSTGGYSSASISVLLGAGEKITFTNNDASVATTITILATARTTSIVAPTDQVSEKSIAFKYANASQYTEATLKDAPIGTYITFKSTGATYTQTTGTNRPTQTDADMSINGIFVTPTTYTANSSSATPSKFMVNLPRGMVADFIAYKDTSKSAYSKSLGLGYHNANATQLGLTACWLDPGTGIMTIDWKALGSSQTALQLIMSDRSFHGTATYITFTASKLAQAVAIPKPFITYLKDVKPGGTAGGTFTAGAWQTRTLNTVEGDTNIVSLSANQFTLQAGKYEIEASATAFRCGGNSILLRNITDSLDVVIGVGTYLGTDGNFASDASELSCVFHINSSKVFELRHRGSTTYTTSGFGMPGPSGVATTFSQVKITKLE